MIKPATYLLFALAIIAGAVLFGVSFKVSELEERLIGLNRDIAKDREAIHVLRAEWSYLNQPERLEALSRRHLDLQPVSGDQLTDPSAIPIRLDPAVEAPFDAAGEAAGEPPVASAGAALPVIKPTPPQRPAQPVRLTAQPSARQAAGSATPDLDAALRAILGDAAAPDAGARR